MTAEIAILNKSAVALAADSAVTVGSSRKIYNTAIKLFALSKYHPVGIMIYANSEFMGIPWETIIKEYRKQLRKRSFEHLTEYAADFIDFLSNLNKKWIREEMQSGFIRQLIADVAILDTKRFVSSVKKRTIELLQKHGEAMNRELLDSFEAAFIEGLKKKLQGFTPVITADDLASSVPDYREFVDALVVAELSKHELAFPVSDDIRGKLCEAITLDVINYWNNESGIVVAGFGEGDVFPCYVEYMVEAIYGSKLKYKEERSKCEGHSAVSQIVPFAQSKLVRRFMEGIDPDYQDEIDELLKSLFTVQFPSKITAALGAVPGLSDEVKAELEDKLRQTGLDELATHKKKLEEYKHRKYVEPITSNLENLPKEELAAMAEALVSITMFKQRISLDESETVGGPIDVAVISKGDGFVWIKRKHYFEPELNSQFFDNYYQQTEKTDGRREQTITARRGRHARTGA